jgi:DNA-binding CsgD family transcriptional regulator
MLQNTPFPLAQFFTRQVWQRLAIRLQLTPRELQIVWGVAQDHSESAIACGLGVSPNTVHTHLNRLYAKLGVANRVELMLLLFGTFLCLTAQPGGGLPPICGHHSAGFCPLRDRRLDSPFVQRTAQTNDEPLTVCASITPAVYEPQADHNGRRIPAYPRNVDRCNMRIVQPA